MYKRQIFFVSTICPETFSYTTEEILKMDMPVVSLPIGAPADRIRLYSKGLVSDSLDARAALEKLKEAYDCFVAKKCLFKYERKILFVADYISFASRYRVEHCMEQLLIQGVASVSYTHLDGYKRQLSGEKSCV